MKNELYLIGKFKITEKTRTSKTAALATAQVGDTLDIRVEVKKLDGDLHRTHQPLLRVTNLNTGDFSIITFNRLCNCLAGYELEQI